MRVAVLVLVGATACGDGTDAPPDAAPPPPDAQSFPDAVHLPICGDGIAQDFPFHCGCDSPDDNDDTIPTPAPACCDGVDSDDDGLVDFPDDPGCTSAADADEFHGPPVGCGPSLVIEPITLPATVSTELVAGPNELESATCGGYGRELAYQFFLEAPATVTITESGAADVVLYVRELCQNPDTEVACVDDPETLVLTDLAPGFYYLILDGYGPGSLGSIELTVEATP